MKSLFKDYEKLDDNLDNSLDLVVYPTDDL